MKYNCPCVKWMEKEREGKLQWWFTTCRCQTFMKNPASWRPHSEITLEECGSRQGGKFFGRRFTPFITFLNPFTKLSLCFWGSCRLFLMILCCCWWSLAWVFSSSCLLVEKEGGHWLTSQQVLIKCCLEMWLMTSIECVCKEGLALRK